MEFSNLLFVLNQSWVALRLLSDKLDEKVLLATADLSIGDSWIISGQIQLTFVG